MVDLALGDELCEGADGVLDRGVGVDTVLVVQVDAVGAEPLQRPLKRGADVIRAAVQVVGTAAGVGDEAELGGEYDLVAAILDRPSDKLLVGERPVDLGGVDERHPQVERSMDGADGLGIVTARPAVSVGHAHGTQTDAGHVQSSQVDVLHVPVSSFSSSCQWPADSCLFALFLACLGRPPRRSLGRPDTSESQMAGGTRAP